MKLIVFYDNWCPNCSKFAREIKKLDWLELLDFKKLREDADVSLFKNLDLKYAEREMASYGKKIHYGYNSLFYIFLRLPLLWLFLPIFILLKISKIGEILYIQLAVKRKIVFIHCDENTCNY